MRLGQRVTQRGGASRGDSPRHVSPVVVAQEGVDEFMELSGPLTTQRAVAQGGPRDLAVGLPDRSQAATKFGLVGLGDRVYRLGEVSGIKQPAHGCEVNFAQPFQAFAAVTQAPADLEQPSGFAVRPL